MRGRVPAGLDALAAGLEAEQAHPGVGDEGVEDADRVGAAADAGDDRVRQPAGQVQHWARASTPMTRVEVAHHRRERVRAGRRADQVVGVSTLATQSRIASFIASLSVREPVVTGTTVAPSIRIRATLSACRRVSSSPM